MPPEPHRSQRPAAVQENVVRSVLPTMLDQRGLRAKAQDFLAAQAFWQALPRLRAQVRAVGFSGGCLILRARDENTARSLERAPHFIFVALPRLPDGPSIRKVRCQVGPLADLPTWDEPPPPPPLPREPVVLDAEVSGALVHVHDEELRDALASLYVTACDAGRPIGAPRSTS